MPKHTPLLDLPAVLGRHGVPPGPDGYDRAALEAAVAARGLRATVEETHGLPPDLPGRRPRGRYRALVWDAAVGRSTYPLGYTGVRGRGRTEEEALALMRWLERRA